jgi:predicted phage tail protein
LIYDDHQTWHIVPIVRGAGGRNSGFLQIVIGIIALVAAYFTYGTSLAFMTPTLVGLGVSMIFSGLSTLLSPMPETNIDDGESTDEKPSFLFNGPMNTVTAGGVVPVVYGEHWVGSKVISAGIKVEDIK